MTRSAPATLTQVKPAGQQTQEQASLGRQSLFAP